MLSDSSLALFSDLLTDLGLSQSDLASDWWPDISLRDFYRLSLAKSFYKKLVDDKSETADDKALQKFLQINERCKNWELKLETSWDEVLMGELKQSIYHFWNPKGYPLVSSFEEITSNLRCGPGKSVGSTWNDFYSKMFSSDLTVTSKGLYQAYRSYIENFPEWINGENVRRENFGEARVVGGNRLRFVPKTRDISRTICIEPTLNMGFQLGFGRILEDRLRTFFGIDLSVQPDINRELARIGSITDQFSTIDLESASDSLSLSMLREVLPRDFFAWLMTLRSPTSDIPSMGPVALNMVSTMGNGFTFPLQTMLFACVVTAAARARGFHLERPRGANGSFGVFGDDIIVPMHCHYFKHKDLPMFEDYGSVLVRDVLRLLSLLGFTVNTSKSFVEGPFRESCGCDFFNGHNVRGVYIKTLRTMQDRFVAINLLNEWSSLSGIPLRRTVHRLLRSVRYTPIPRWEQPDSGVRVPFSFVRNLRRDKNCQSILYRRWEPITRSFKIGEASILGKKTPIYNPSGLLISFLGSYIRDCKIGIRSSGTLSYKSRFALAPNWDQDGTVVAKATGLRWNTAVATNFSLEATLG